MKYNTLNNIEKNIILHKDTEKPFTGKYNDNTKKGIYICKQCDSKLYNSTDKYNSQCGWPSFDDEIDGMVKRIPDADGVRVEILCNNCGGHLGHVFEGEGHTPKNIRHCVNSVSLNFIPESIVDTKETAVFAGGCFWGMEYHFKNKKGVISTNVGYTGGDKNNPTYEEVCANKTGHIEVLKVEYASEKISYEELTKFFFEIHDPTQLNRQGPDIGEQYKSAIFYADETQKIIAEKLILILHKKGIKIVTELIETDKFWPAEDYHQDYYNKTKKTPYCHIYKKRF